MKTNWATYMKRRKKIDDALLEKSQIEINTEERWDKISRSKWGGIINCVRRGNEEESYPPTKECLENITCLECGQLYTQYCGDNECPHCGYSEENKEDY